MIASSEWIAVIVVVTAATAFFSYLVYVRAADLSHPPRVIWRGLLAVWLCLAAAIVVLAGARAILGGPIIRYSAGGAGFSFSTNAPGSLLVTVAALIVVALLLYFSLHTVRQLQEPPKSDQARPPSDDSQESP